MPLQRYAETPMLWMMRWAMSLLLVGLTIFAALTPHREGTAAWVTLAVAGVGLLVSFACGVWGKLPTGVWLTVLLACWVVMFTVSANTAYIAFSLFFLQSYLLRRPLGFLAVALTLGVSVAGLSWHQGYFSVGVFLGPALGAAFAVTVVHSFQVLQQESERRRRLLVELESTRAELLRSERHAGTLEERERLAAEIHDTLAQGFTSIQLLLGSAQRLMATQPGTAADLLEQARQTTKDNLQEARGLVAAMAPADLQRNSLADVLRRLAASTTERSGVEVEVKIDEDAQRLDVSEAAVLVRVAQSAMANVVQHAFARHATITLSRSGDAASDARAINLAIADDGVGFDTETGGPEVGRGYGLGLMRRRLERVGGDLTVVSVARGASDTTQPSGTIVSATLPARLAPTVTSVEAPTRDRQSSLSSG